MGRPDVKTELDLANGRLKFKERVIRTDAIRSVSLVKGAFRWRPFAIGALLIVPGVFIKGVLGDLLLAVGFLWALIQIVDWLIGGRTTWLQVEYSDEADESQKAYFRVRRQDIELLHSLLQSSVNR